MRNMERQKFEESWKKAFDQAEVSPSDNVWTNVELDLEKARGNSLKKRLVFFQLLAAASIVFALGVGVGVYVLNSSDKNVMLTDNRNADKKSTEIAASQKTKSESNNSSTQITTNDKTSTTVKKSRSFEIENSGNGPRVEESQSTFIVANEEEEGLGLNGKTAEEKALVLVPLKLNDEFWRSDRNAQIPQQPKSELKESIADPVALMLAKLDEREKAIQQKEEKAKEKTSEKLWTSIGFAAGSFNPVNSGVTSPPPTTTTMSLAQSNSIANQEVKASGITYSIGANIGTKLTERWVFQGGVNYLTQSADYTAHNVVGTSDFSSFRPATIHEIDNIAEGDDVESKLVATSPYNVNNSLRYLSIPLQAGYLIINRDFGLQLNAGIATDIFLQNTVTAEGANVDATTQDIGEDTPYRTVNLSGLMGTEFSYRFSERYRISLNPGLRYPFSSIYRSELPVKATPLTFDVGLRFRYIFK
jgi:hypothetical protein